MMVYGRVDRIASHIQRLNREEMRRTGTRILYTPRRRCSCLGVLTRQVDVACRVCDGVGWFWEDCDQRVMLAIVQSASLHKDLVAAGLVQNGDMVVQFDRAPRGLAPWDRVRLNPHGLHTFDIAGEDAIVTRSRGDSDTLQYRVFRVMAVTQTFPRTGRVIHYAATDYDYCPFTNVLTWLGTPECGTAPGEGEQYSVQYLADYDWIVSEPTAPTAIGPVGFQGKIPISRRFKNERHKDELEKDAPPEDLDDLEDDDEELV